MPPEDAPEYRVPGPRALTPQERAFRRWLEAHAGGAVALAAIRSPQQAENLIAELEAAFAAGALWAREAGRGGG